MEHELPGPRCLIIFEAFLMVHTESQEGCYLSCPAFLIETEHFVPGNLIFQVKNCIEAANDKFVSREREARHNFQ
jgi:hypothetical protein